MSNQPTFRFQYKPTSQTTDTDSPAIARPPSLQCEFSSGAHGLNCRGSEWEQGLIYKTRAGIRVRSKIEKIIADFLHSEHMPFTYEPQVFLSHRLFRPDFYLPNDGLYYEHFGLNGAAYLAKAETKVAAFRRNGLKLIYTTIADEPEIEDAIIEQIAFATLE